MNNKDIEWRRKKLEGERQKLESEQWNSLRQLLPNDVIERICEDCKYQFRTRLLTPLVIVFHMIGAGVSREGSFQSSWEIIGQSGQSGSLAKGRRRIPRKVWQGLDQWIVEEIDKEFGELSHWRGHRVVGVDGTCLSMSDKAELIEHFGRAGSRSGKSRFPIARSTLAFDLGTLVTIGHELGAYRKCEMELFRPILKHLRPGDVVVADRQFSGANLYAEYQQAGVDFIIRVHGHLKVEDLQILKEFSPGDGLVKMQVYPEHRREDPKDVVGCRCLAFTDRRRNLQGILCSCGWVKFGSLVDFESSQAVQEKT